MKTNLFQWLIAFCTQQLLCCIFPLAIFGTLALSRKLPLGSLPRYDFILLACIGVQAAMLRFRLETRDELKVISLFHGIGLIMELYKTRVGSWAYPEFAYSKIAGVPLYSGFMYASVASYMCQAWRRFDLRLVNFPSGKLTLPIALAVYGNFFTRSLLPDFRWFLTAGIFLLFRRTIVVYSVRNRDYRMPLFAAFVLIGLFIWVAENIATYFGAWQYPNQKAGWEPVGLSKWSSWFLLVVIVFLIVAQLKHVKAKHQQENEGGQ